MSTDRNSVLAHFITTLRGMGEEWQDSEAISEETRILGDLNWRSVEIVFLVNEVQKHYGMVFPFEGFVAEIEKRETMDSPVGEWVDFIYQHLAKADEGAASAALTS